MPTGGSGITGQGPSRRGPKVVAKAATVRIMAVTLPVGRLARATSTRAPSGRPRQDAFLATGATSSATGRPEART